MANDVIEGDINKNLGGSQVGAKEEMGLDEIDREARALLELASFPWAYAEEIGKPVPRYNNAIRINIIKEKRAKVVRSPIKFLNFLKYVQSIGPVGAGLKVNLGSSPSYIHVILEAKNPVALWFYDYKKALGTDKLIQAVNLLRATNIKAGVIITNIIALHARDFAERERKEGEFELYVYRYSDIINGR